MQVDFIAVQQYGGTVFAKNAEGFTQPARDTRLFATRKCTPAVKHCNFTPDFSNQYSFALEVLEI